VPASPESITALLELELSALSDSRVVDHIRSLLVTPKCQSRPWDYGQPGEEFPCWLVLEHLVSNTAIAYCEQGFGPEMPWGLLFLTGKHMSMGMDSGWFEHFLEAYFDSQVAPDLPIWRVFQHSGTDYPGTAITPEGSWDVTWAEVLRLRGANDGYRYDCSQSIFRRDA
jgi:hypothetical protein